MTTYQSGKVVAATDDKMSLATNCVISSSCVGARQKSLSLRSFNRNNYTCIVAELSSGIQAAQLTSAPMVSQRPVFFHASAGNSVGSDNLLPPVQRLVASLYGLPSHLPIASISSSIKRSSLFCALTANGNNE
jgi:hypothetical protein